MGAQLNWVETLSGVVVNPWWGRLKILQVIIILPSDLVLIKVLSVTLEIRPRMLLKRMFKSLVMFCLIRVSLLSRQSLKCLNLKLPVTCQDGCSQISLPRNVPYENILFGVNI